MSEKTKNTFFPQNVPGERMVNFLTDHRRKKFAQRPGTRELMITAAGYHPHAEGHYCKRPRGSRGFVFLYCIDGSGWVKFEDQDIIITRNLGVFLKPDEAHEYGASKSQPWSYYYIHYEGDSAAPYTRMILDEKTSGTYWIKETDEFLKCFTMILSNLEEGWNFPNMLMASAHLHKLLSYVYLKKQHDADSIHNASTETRIQAIAEMIEENPHNNVSVMELARAANLSNSRFRELFRKIIGMSPKRYSLHMQIERAKELLLSDNLCIYEVSERSGFTDSRYFSRVFSKEVGMTPSDYRAQHLKS